jgi:hypothetical protein
MVGSPPTTRVRSCRPSPDGVPSIAESAFMLNADEPNSAAVPDRPSASADRVNGFLPASGAAAWVASSRIAMWALAVAAGLAAGVIAWAIGEVTIMPERGRMAARGEIVTPPSVIGTHNGIVSFGALGAALGLGMGLTGGIVRRSFLSACLAGLMGLCLGGGAGVVTSWLIIPIFYKHITDDDLTYSLMTHGGIWTAVGGTAGLAFALGLGGWGRIARAMLGGVGAALLATLIYEVAGGILSPFAMTNLPVSVTWQSRLAARLLVAVLVVVGVVLSAGSGDEGQSDGKT